MKNKKMNCKKYFTCTALSACILMLAACSSSKDSAVTTAADVTLPAMQTTAASPETTKPSTTEPVSTTQAATSAVKPTQSATEAPTQIEMAFRPCNELQYTTTKLNVRKAPDKNAQKVTTLAKGTPVHCTGYGDGWTRITLNGSEYYVASDYLSTTAPEDEAIISSTEAETQPVIDPNDPFTYYDDIVYTTRKLNLRTEPSEDSTVITVLPKDFTLHRTGLDGDWTRVEVNGNTCYVASKYLTTTLPNTPVTPTQAPETQAPATQPATQPASGTIVRTETANGILYTGNSGPLIAIDPGHQGKGNNNLEAIGPGSTETKKMVSYGTSGCVTGLAESQLNLIVSMRLCTELLNQGYNVLMIRESQDVDISNVTRTQRAVASGAAILIHVHANGSSNAEKRGAETLCPRNDNPYMTAENIAQSQTLAKLVIDGLCQTTGMPNLGLYYTNAMSGINWSSIPVTTIEMGFMSNATDDAIMITPDFQLNLVAGVCDGINKFFGR